MEMAFRRYLFASFPVSDVSPLSIIPRVHFL